MTAPVAHHWLNGWETYEGWGIPIRDAVAPGPVVSSAVADGTVDRTSPSILTGDVGYSEKVGTWVAWIYGDTIYTPAAVDGSSFRDATASIGSASDIHTTSEPLDANGAPYELFSPQDTATSGTRRPYWPDSLFPHPNGTDMIIFYVRCTVPDGDVFRMYVELAAVDELLASSKTTVDRSNETVLFNAPEPCFCSGPVLVGGYLHLYTWGEPGPGVTELIPDHNYYLCRVPLADYRTRASYEFWAGRGTGWSSNIANCVPIVLQGSSPEDRAPGWGGISVKWNAYLGKYLMTQSQGSPSPAGEAPRQKVILRTADAPEGPWSGPTRITVPTASSDPRLGVYTARWHPHFATGGGQVIPVTYSRIIPGFSQELPVVWVTFA